MSTVKKIINNTSWLAISEIIGKGISFASIVLIARYLGDEGFGKYAFAMAMAMIFIVFVDFGFHTFVTREIARKKQDAKIYLENLCVSKIILSIFIYIIMIGFVFIIGKPADIRHLVYLSGIYMILHSFNTFFRGVYQGVEKMKYHAINYILEKILFICLVVLFISLKFGIVGILYAIIISTGIGFIYNIFTIYFNITPFSFKINFKIIKKTFKKSFWFLATSVFIIIYFKIDILMLSLMKDDIVVGHYNAAYNLLYAFLFIPGVVTMAVYPVLSRLFKRNINLLKQKLNIITKYYILAAIPTVLFFFTLGPYLIKILYGNEFKSSMILFQVLSFAFLFVFISYILSFSLNAVDKQKYTTIAAAICMLVNIVINFLLIPSMAAMGAVIATIITEMLICILYLIFLNKAINIINKNTLIKLIKIIIIILLIAIAVYIGYYINNIIGLIMGMITFFISIIIFKLITKSDFQIIKEIYLVRKN